MEANVWLEAEQTAAHRRVIGGCFRGIVANLKPVTG